MTRANLVSQKASSGIFHFLAPWLAHTESGDKHAAFSWCPAPPLHQNKKQTALTRSSLGDC